MLVVFVFLSVVSFDSISGRGVLTDGESNGDGVSSQDGGVGKANAALIQCHEVVIVERLLVHVSGVTVERAFVHLEGAIGDLDDSAVAGDLIANGQAEFVTNG